jgi:hypothetical protein
VALAIGHSPGVKPHPEDKKMRQQKGSTHESIQETNTSYLGLQTRKFISISKP